ncbi:hypothetical protein TcCL_ESM04251 [Trypanosoma cruzi]|nr:hypothetical protein TcCL_ESM04251 [Trypanosoma cruzi]
MHNDNSVKARRTLPGTYLANNDKKLQPRTAMNPGPHSDVHTSSYRDPFFSSTDAAAMATAKGALSADNEGGSSPAWDSSLLFNPGGAYDSRFKTPRSSHSTEHIGGVWEAFDDDEHTRRRRLWAFCRLYRDQESRERFDIIVEQVLMMRSILSAEFDERLRLLPESEATIMRLEREAVEAMHRLIEEHVWGLQRVFRKFYCPKAPGESSNPPPTDTASVGINTGGDVLFDSCSTIKTTAEGRLLTEEEEEEKELAKAAKRAEEDYALLCACAGGEVWLNKAECRSHLEEETGHFTPIQRQMPLREPSPCSLTPCPKEKWFEAQNPLTPVPLDGPNDVVQCAEPFALISFLLFMPAGVFVRCVRVLQRLHDSRKVVVWFAIGSTRRVLEGLIWLVNHVYPIQLTKLSIFFTVGATVRCGRGTLQVAFFHLYMTVGSACRAASALKLAGAKAMIAARTAISDTSALATGWCYEALVLFPIGCGVKLTDAAAEGTRRMATTTKRTMSFSRRAGMYMTCLTLGAGAKAAAKMSVAASNAMRGIMKRV